jgi:hypothetical protein
MMERVVHDVSATNPKHCILSRTYDIARINFEEEPMFC